MMLSKIEAQNLDKESLIKFLSLRVKEGPQIDYKESLSGGNKDAYREFLKDTTAFANAAGGILLLGIKEPLNGISTEDQIIGIRGSEDLAKDLERVAATSIDPRIPGLILKTVLISDDRHIILVYIPPSLIRPHMVCHGNHRCFYVRHSESSVPMTTHEIRDVVLSSATSEGRARNYMIEEEVEALEYVIKDNPAFLLQAMPLLVIMPPWDVMGKPIDKVVRGEDRSNKYKYGQFSLHSSISPTPTIKGVMGRESRDSQPWITEVHRNGFAQVVYMDIQTFPRNTTKWGYELHEGYADLFRSFLDMCNSLWEETQTDTPYLYRAKYFNAQNTRFHLNEYKITPAYGRRVITWPDEIRQVGESVERIRYSWTEQLFHAFGLNWKAPAG